MVIHSAPWRMLSLWRRFLCAIRTLKSLFMNLTLTFQTRQSSSASVSTFCCEEFRLVKWLVLLEHFKVLFSFPVSLKCQVSLIYCREIKLKSLFWAQQVGKLKRCEWRSEKTLKSFICNRFCGTCRRANTFWIVSVCLLSVLRYRSSLHSFRMM